MSDFNIIINDKHKKILNKFFRYLKNRLACIKQDINDGYICGKLVPHSTHDRIIIQRCYGVMSKYGCYNCNATGFLCKECGTQVGSAEEDFCGGYCSWAYYGKPDVKSWRY